MVRVAIALCVGIIIVVVGIVVDIVPVVVVIGVGDHQVNDVEDGQHESDDAEGTHIIVG